MFSSILLFILVTLGSFLTALTGVGGGTLILAGLLLIYPPELSLPLHSFTQLTINGLRSGIFFREVDWKVVFSYSTLMLPAAWLGAILFQWINPSILKIFLGFFIIISIIPGRDVTGRLPGYKTFLILGALSGFVGIFVGVTGPAVAPYFNRLERSRVSILSTKSAGQMLLQLSKIFAFSGAGGVDFFLLKGKIGWIVTGTLIGVLFSIHFSKKISDEKYRILVNTLLVLISIKILVEGIKEVLY